MKLTLVVATPKDQLKMAKQIRAIEKRSKRLIIAHAHGQHSRKAPNCPDCQYQVER